MKQIFDWAKIIIGIVLLLIFLGLIWKFMSGGLSFKYFERSVFDIVTDLALYGLGGVIIFIVFWAIIMNEK